MLSFSNCFNFNLTKLINFRKSILVLFARSGFGRRLFKVFGNYKTNPRNFLQSVIFKNKYNSRFLKSTFFFYNFFLYKKKL